MGYLDERLGRQMRATKPGPLNGHWTADTIAVHRVRVRVIKCAVTASLAPRCNSAVSCHGNWCLSLPSLPPWIADQSTCDFFLSFFLQSFQLPVKLERGVWKFQIWPQQALLIVAPSRSSQEGLCSTYYQDSILVKTTEGFLYSVLTSFRFTPALRRRNEHCLDLRYGNLVPPLVLCFVRPFVLLWINHIQTNRSSFVVFSLSSTLLAAASRLSSFAL